jgi:NAD(P)-dependent dehydrogenase (short-subunit alcohol dehydrogenase family)
MLTVQYAKALPEIKFNAVEPGFTATDLTAGFPGGRPVEDSAEGVVRMATIGKDGPAGAFWEDDHELPWQGRIIAAGMGGGIRDTVSLRCRVRN